MASANPSQRRLRQALVLVLVSVVVLSTGVGLVWWESAKSSRTEQSGPVIANWDALAPEVRQIRVQTRDQTFDLERQDGRWLMPSRGGYRVDDARIADLDQAMRDLQYESSMTRNPAMFERLSLGDPADGGEGIRLTILSGEGAVLADLIMGRSRGEDGVYLRPAGGPRAYAASGTMPALADPGYWLGLEFMNLDPGSVARSRVVPSEGTGYELARAGLSARNFDLRSPRGYTMTTAGAANGVAVAGARVRFRDVRPAAVQDDLPSASHAAVMFSGLAYSYTFYPEGRRYWARLEITAVSNDVEERARRLTRMTDGWEFEVSEDAYERMTRPISIFAAPG